MLQYLSLLSFSLSIILLLRTPIRSAVGRAPDVVAAAAAKRRRDERGGLHGAGGGLLFTYAWLERRHVRAARRPLGSGRRLRRPCTCTCTCTCTCFSAHLMLPVQCRPRLETAASRIISVAHQGRAASPYHPPPACSSCSREAGEHMSGGRWQIYIGLGPLGRARPLIPAAAAAAAAASAPLTTSLSTSWAARAPTACLWLLSAIICSSCKPGAGQAGGHKQCGPSAPSFLLAPGRWPCPEPAVLTRIHVYMYMGVGASELQ